MFALILVYCWVHLWTYEIHDKSQNYLIFYSISSFFISCLTVSRSVWYTSCFLAMSAGILESFSWLCMWGSFDSFPWLCMLGYWNIFPGFAILVTVPWMAKLSLETQHCFLALNARKSRSVSLLCIPETRGCSIAQNM